MNKVKLDPIFKARTMAVIGVSSHNDSHPANVIYNKITSVIPLMFIPSTLKGAL